MFRRLNEEEEPPFGDINVTAEEGLLIILVLTLSVVVSYLILRYRLGYLPESVGSIVVGFVFGGIISIHYGDDLDNLLQFDPQIFFYGLLPPIIFEAGYSLKRRAFFDNFGSILTYAVLGTTISTLLVGFIIYAAAKNGYIKESTISNSDGGLDALSFAALISAVDPVATLSIMHSKDVNAHPLLVSLIFGESILNDAVAIVLFQTFQTIGHSELNSHTMGVAVLRFFVISFGSTFIGVLYGVLFSVYLRFSIYYKVNPNFEIILTFCVAYLSYFTAETIELSGILAMFFNGVILGHYNWYNISRSSQVVTGHFFKALSYIAETLVFAYMGISMWQDGLMNTWDWGFVLFTLLGCFVGRAANIFPLSFLINWGVQDPADKIPLNMQAVMWWGGLRGAIAYALALNWPNPEQQPYVVSGTIFVVLFTTVGQGPPTGAIVKAMGLSMSGGEHGSMADRSTMGSSMAPGHGDSSHAGGGDSEQLSMAGPSLLRRRKGKSLLGKLVKQWQAFDKRVVYGWLRNTPLHDVQQGGRGHATERSATAGMSQMTFAGQVPPEDDIFMMIRQECNDPMARELTSGQNSQYQEGSGGLSQYGNWEQQGATSNGNVRNQTTTMGGIGTTNNSMLPSGHLHNERPNSWHAHAGTTDGAPALIALKTGNPRAEGKGGLKQPLVDSPAEL
jgi:sodium/hydrogen exchanger 8